MGVLIGPTSRIRYFIPISGCGQYLREQWIGIQRDPAHQLVQLLGSHGRRRLRRVALLRGIVLLRRITLLLRITLLSRVSGRWRSLRTRRRANRHRHQASPNPAHTLTPPAAAETPVTASPIPPAQARPPIEAESRAPVWVSVRIIWIRVRVAVPITGTIGRSGHASLHVVRPLVIARTHPAERL